jgi:hypothetical protein
MLSHVMKRLVRRGTVPLVAIAIAAMSLCGIAHAQPADDAQKAAPAKASPSASDDAKSTVAATPNPAARLSDCKRFVALLAGGKVDKKTLADPAFQMFAATVPDLVTCGVVARDSDDLCVYSVYPPLAESDMNGFVSDAAVAYKSCREGWSNFHELRTYPKGRSFMVEDVKCRTTKELKPICERIVAVMRSGDATKCPSLGEFQTMCRAFISLDTSQCQAPKGDGFVGQHGDEFAKSCVSLIESKGSFAKGLQAMAASATGRDRQLAKAALGQADACADYEKAAVEKCVAADPTAAPSGQGQAPAHP